MIKSFGFVNRVTGQVDAKLFEGVLVACRQNDCGMHFAVAKARELLGSLCRNGIVHGTNGKCDEKLIGVQSRVFAAKKPYLEVCNGLKDLGRNEIDAIINACKCFQSVKECRRCRTQKARGLARDDGAVG